jgi:hypothetical protein
MAIPIGMPIRLQILHHADEEEHQKGPQAMATASQAAFARESALALPPDADRRYGDQRDDRSTDPAQNAPMVP